MPASINGNCKKVFFFNKLRFVIKDPGSFTSLLPTQAVYLVGVDAMFLLGIECRVRFPEELVTVSARSQATASASAVGERALTKLSSSGKAGRVE